MTPLPASLVLWATFLPQLTASASPVKGRDVPGQETGFQPRGWRGELAFGGRRAASPGRGQCQPLRLRLPSAIQDVSGPPAPGPPRALSTYLLGCKSTSAFTPSSHWAFEMLVFSWFVLGGESARVTAGEAHPEPGGGSLAREKVSIQGACCPSQPGFPRRTRPSGLHTEPTPGVEGSVHLGPSLFTSHHALYL